MIACITDEVSADLAEACEALRRMGIGYCELRNVGSQRIGPEMQSAQLRGIGTLLVEYGIRLEAISSGLWKEGWDGQRTADRAEDALTRMAPLRDILKCTELIVFGFRRQPEKAAPALNELVDFYGKAALHAQALGVTLLLENHSSCAVATTEDLAAIVAGVSHPHLKANWDPANDFLRTSNVFHPSAKFRELLPHIHSVHVKDIGGERQGVRLGEGKIGWPAILTCLAGVGWTGRFTLEPHRKTGVASVLEDHDALLKLGRGSLA